MTMTIITWKIILRLWDPLYWDDGGAGVDIIDGGAGNDSITDGDGKDIITGGAGNDIITLNTSGDDDTIVFVGKSTAAPYVGTNNGTDTISTVVAADTIFRVYPLEGINGGGGSDDDYTLDLTEITATSATPDELSDQVKLVDTNVAPASMTTTIIAGYIQTTTATANNYMKMADNGSGIIAFGDVAGGNEPVYIYWVDSLLDGDGTDVTAADVHLLVMTQDNLDLDTLTADNFDL